jgi:hypothetical protein
MIQKPCKFPFVSGHRLYLFVSETDYEHVPPVSEFPALVFLQVPETVLLGAEKCGEDEFRFRDSNPVIPPKKVHQNEYEPENQEETDRKEQNLSFRMMQEDDDSEDGKHLAKESPKKEQPCFFSNVVVKEYPFLLHDSPPFARN